MLWTQDPAWGRGSQWTEGGGPRCSRRVCLGDSAVPGCSVWPEGAWRRVRTPPVLWGHLSSCLPKSVLKILCRMEIIIVIIIHRGQFCGSICGSSKLRFAYSEYFILHTKCGLLFLALLCTLNECHVLGILQSILRVKFPNQLVCDSSGILSRSSHQHKETDHLQNC
ncbi:uncharacterized protein LOC129654589 isoform X1 [Bubalus kerabau]|uniref:uncharacterized protein LOC129654589 isoform X1 n=1 Tax=Bubalus carabanensis TaxID=3119969 RepID=UPI00244EBB92|nr:uncharacterized protein LOC129654589 isoform X1 [Bubalus carabanensis]